MAATDKKARRSPEMRSPRSKAVFKTPQVKRATLTERPLAADFF